MRTLSDAMVEALSRQETGEVFVILITLDHDSFAETLRFSSDPTERHSDVPLIYKTISNGEDYYFIPMQIILPTDQDAKPPVAQIQVSNVGQELIGTLRSLSTPVTVGMSLCLASDSDDTVPLPEFQLVQIDYDEQWIKFSALLDSMANEPFPAGTFNPSYFPGLFA